MQPTPAPASVAEATPTPIPNVWDAPSTYGWGLAAVVAGVGGVMIVAMGNPSLSPREVGGTPVNERVMYVSESTV